MIDLGDYWVTTKALLENPIMQVLLTLIIALILQLIVRVVISWVVHQAVGGAHYATKSDARKREQTLIGIFRTAAALVLWIMVAVFVLNELGINIAALMTGAGIIGVVVGFGAQSTIKDFLAGLFIIVENQYRVGDLITLRALGTELTGTVEDLTVRITRIRDLDGNMHIIPNGTSLSVTNMSFGYANVNVDVEIDYKNDVRKVQKLVDEVGDKLFADPLWQKQIVQPIRFLRVEKFADKTITVKALGRVAPGVQWIVAGEFRDRLITVFKSEGIAVSHEEADKDKKSKRK